jgi:hypothetical protein
VHYRRFAEAGEVASMGSQAGSANVRPIGTGLPRDPVRQACLTGEPMPGTHVGVEHRLGNMPAEELIVGPLETARSHLDKQRVV